MSDKQYVTWRDDLTDVEITLARLAGKVITSSRPGARDAFVNRYGSVENWPLDVIAYDGTGREGYYAIKHISGR